MKNNILITGAGGYIGSKMVEFFLKKGFRVTALDRFFFGDNLADLKKNKKLKIVKDDTRLFDKNILKNIDFAIDLASISNDPASELNPPLTRSINYGGSLRVARLAKKMGMKRYVFASSCSIYGNNNGIYELNESSQPGPISEYAKSKTKTERQLLKLSDKNFSVTIARNATVYGVSKRRMRFDLIVNVMTLQALKNKRIKIMGGGKQWRPLIHIDDCINAFDKIIAAPIGKVSGQIFNVGSNKQNYRVSQIAQLIKKQFPNIAIEELPDNPDPRSYRVNFDKINHLLNFKTRKTPEDGIREVKLALENGDIKENIKSYTVKYYQRLIEGGKLS